MALKQKNLKEVVDTLSPLLFIKFFDISIFLGHRKVPLRSFLVFWDNKLFTRNRDTTLLGIEDFVNWHFLKHRRFPLLNIRALSEKTSLKENPDFLKQKFFPIPEFSDRLRASTTKILALRQKKIDGNSWHSLPLYPWKLPISHFSRTQKGSRYDVFRYCETTYFRQEIVIFSSLA